MFDLTKIQKETIWNQYIALFSAKQADPLYWSEKHCTRVLTNLMACRDFSWRVVGITIKALDQYEKQGFKRADKDGITRGHIISRVKTTQTVMNLDKHLSLDKFFEIWLANDKTVLCARGENKKVLPEYLPFENVDNLFNCKDMLVGHRHLDKEIAFLNNLYLERPKAIKNNHISSTHKLPNKIEAMTNDHISLVYKMLKEKILESDDVFCKQLKGYVGFKLRGRQIRNFADVNVQKDEIKIQISKYPNYSDPKKMLKESKNEDWTLGYHLIIRSADDISDAIKLIEQSCNFVRNQLKTKNSSK